MPLHDFQILIKTFKIPVQTGFALFRSFLGVLLGHAYLPALLAPFAPPDPNARPDQVTPSCLFLV